MNHISSTTTVFYRLGDPEEENIYKSGSIPTQNNGRSVHFSEDLDSVHFYLQNKDSKHGTNNPMDTLYTLSIEYTPSNKLCTVRKMGVCRSLVFLNPDEVKVKSVHTTKVKHG